MPNLIKMFFLRSVTINEKNEKKKKTKDGKIDLRLIIY